MFYNLYHLLNNHKYPEKFLKVKCLKLIKIIFKKALITKYQNLHCFSVCPDGSIFRSVFPFGKFPKPFKVF